jgi:streptogramin lyase
VPADPASGPATAPPARPPRNRRPIVLGVATAMVAAVAVAAAVVLWPRAETPPPASTAAGTLVGQPIPVGREPLDIDSGEGFLWTANASDGTISKIDPAAGTSQQIPVGGAPAELAVADGSVWVRNFPDAITRLDIATGHVDEPIKVRREIDGITAGGGSLWLSHAATGTVSRIDTQSRAVEGSPTKVGSKPAALAWGDRRLGERRLFVVDTADHTLTTIDGGSAKVLGAPLPLAGEPGAVAEYKGVLYVGTTAGVVPIDERSRVVGDPIPLKGGSLFAPDAKGVWVAFPLQNELRRVDLRGGETRGDPLRGVGRGLGDMVFVDGVLWVTNSDEGTVSRIRVS